MARFVVPTDKLEIETKNGLLILENSEYFKIVEENKNDCLMISKQGVSKIEDFFDIKPSIPNIQQQWNNNMNFNIIITIEIKSEFGDAFGCASANPMNLKGDIARAYPIELGVKRARTTACLELLRKNYTGKEPLALLYSTFDEFKAENSINNPDKEENKDTSKQEKNKGTSIDETKENNQHNDNIVDKNSVNKKFNELCFTKKYTDGIELVDMFNQDKTYFKQVATRPNKYRDLANDFLNSIGQTVSDL